MRESEKWAFQESMEARKKVKLHEYLERFSVVSPEIVRRMQAAPLEHYEGPVSLTLKVE